VTSPEEVGVGPPSPEGNPDLRGHDAADETLLRAFQSGRLPHAWLITGPRGIGKATLAYRCARFILAQDGQGQDQGQEQGLFGAASPPDSLYLDPAHPVFRRVASGGHADLRVLTRGVDEKTGKPRSEIPVRDIRRLGDFLHMTASEGGWRTVIVDPVDELNRSAANALLKVLEEPPANALLLLVCHAPGNVPATIRSRCCHLPLSPLPEAVVAELLAAYAPGVAADDRAALARLAEGSIGHALDLAAGGGLALYRDMVRVMDDLPRLDAARLHAFGERLAKDRDGTSFRTGMELLSWWLARMIKGGATGHLPAEIVAGEGGAMERLLARRPLAQWVPVWEKTARCLSRTETANLDRKQAVIATFLDIEAFAS
jgi:DNA polymerase III subunit delta'